MRPAIVIATFTMGLGTIRALGRMSVPVIALHYDARDMGYVSKYVRQSVCCPHPEKQEAAFLDFLVQSARTLGGGVLMPTSDAALAAVSRHKDLLAEYYLVACPEFAIVRQLLQKENTYALAERAGVPAPRTQLIRSVADAEQYSRACMYPVLVKPSESHRYYDVFGQKMLCVSSAGELMAAFQRAADANLSVMVQEFIPGGDSLGVNYNSYFWDGEPLVEFTAEKVRNGPPVYGSPRVVVSKDAPEVVASGRKILRATGFYGYSCTEFKRDSRDGVYKLMEVNGRHNLSCLLAVHCGINFPWIQYAHLTQGALPSTTQFRHGVYWIDEFRDLGYSLKGLRTEGYRPSEYLRPYFSPHVFAILDWQDLKPFLKRSIDLTKRGMRALVGNRALNNA